MARSVSVVPPLLLIQWFCHFYFFGNALNIDDGVDNLFEGHVEVLVSTIPRVLSGGCSVLIIGKRQEWVSCNFVQVATKVCRAG